METHCPRWYQINVAKLSAAELHRATGGGAAFWLSLPLHLLAGATGHRRLAPDVVPEELTAIERLELALPVPEPLGALGFVPFLTLSLPEFSGSNVIHMLADEGRQTVCELLVARSAHPEASWQGAHSVLASGLEDGQFLRTIASPECYPTKPPPGHHVVLAQGADPESLYARHLDELRRLAEAAGSSPVVFDEGRCIAAARRSHRELVAHQVARGVFVEADPALVEALFRDNGLTRSEGGGR